MLNQGPTVTNNISDFVNTRDTDNRRNPRSAVGEGSTRGINHSYPSTDLLVTELLEELAALGLDVTEPDDPRTKQRRCFLAHTERLEGTTERSVARGFSNFSPSGPAPLVGGVGGLYARFPWDPRPLCSASYRLLRCARRLSSPLRKGYGRPALRGSKGRRAGASGW